MKIDQPFNISWNITVRGRTQGDGEVYTITSQIIRDKLQYLLDKMMHEGKIQEYNISATVDNLEEAIQVIEKSKQ